MLLLAVLVNGLALATVCAPPALTTEEGESVSGYLPAPMAVVEKMLELARVKPGEKVYDLGSGDGRIVIMAAQKYGARGYGIELDSKLCQAARVRIASLGLGSQVTIIEGSFFHQDLSAADVITVYLDPRGMERVRKLLETFLHHGLRIVVCESELTGWKPTVRVSIHDKESNKAFAILLYEISRPGDWTSFGAFGKPARGRPATGKVLQKSSEGP